MCIAVYLENQIHGRTYAGPEAGERFSRILEKATGSGLLSGVHIFGDTMFNTVQLKQLDGEISELSKLHPELADDAQSLRSLIAQITKDLGYMWLSGD